MTLNRETLSTPKWAKNLNREKLKPSKDQELIAGIYFKSNAAAKKKIMNYYKGDPAGFMDDMRIYKDQGFTDLVDIWDYIQMTDPTL